MTILTRRHAGLALIGLALPALARAQQPAPSAEAPAPSQPPAPTGGPVATVRITQTQASFIGSVSWGRGRLNFQGQQRSFRIRGLGAGGIGYSTMNATGEVYNLTRIQDFPGSYAQGRAGAVMGSQQVRGGLWLINQNGVQISLHPQRHGVALQLGGDALLIEFVR